MNITVVKLGGSLFNTTELLEWLAQLEQQSQQQTIIIVPGGGPFADQVREAQQKVSFDDKTAHHMAILAMAQYGLLIASQIKAAQLFYYPSDINNLTLGLYIWIPDRHVLTAPELPQSWALTSDTLALWLSQQVAADELHIIKRKRSANCQISDLMEQGLLDEAFLSIYRLKPVSSKLFFYRDINSYSANGAQLQ